MRKSNIFDDARAFYKDNPHRLDDRMVEYGREWRSKTMPASKFILCWLAATGEFYVKDTISFKVYLMDRKAPLEKDADHFLFNHIVLMEETNLERHFPEFVQIASPEGTVASPGPEKAKVVQDPDPYSKWRKTPINDSGSKREEKTGNAYFDAIESGGAEFDDNPPF